MHQRDHTIDLIERALRAQPYCPSCGEHTDVVAIGGELVLRCSAIGHPRTRLERWFGSILAPDHVSYPIIEAGLAQAA